RFEAIMDPEQFREVLGTLDYPAFERFIVALLARTGRFREIQLNALVDSYEVDIQAVEADPIAGPPRRWLFDVKRSKLVGSDVVRFLSAKKTAFSDQRVQFVLV